MSIDIIVKVVPGGLAAANQAEASKLEPFAGREMSVSLSNPRNLAFHRKFFALLYAGRELANTEFNAEQFRAVVTTGAGWADFIEQDGRMVAVPRSISFASMKQEEFENLYSDVLDFICNNWVVDREQIDQILTFM